MTSTARPVTSKARGVCRYYNAPRGCFAGDRCKFLHGEPPIEAKPDDPPMLTPYDKGKRCRYYAQGFCKRGEACWFLHTVPTDSTSANEEDDEFCSICFDKPSTYGLLTGCSHIFCTTCIKQWRDKKPTIDMQSANTKKCPMCRTPSKFITPSSKFVRDGTEEKTNIIQAYKESMARVPCRYFQKSLKKNKDRPICPYGKDCFYQHLKEDGTPFIFKDGVDVSLRKYRASQRMWPDEPFMPFALDLASLDIALSSSDPVIVGPVARSDSNRRDEEGNNIGSISYAVGRLRDVGRSLEMLNDAIGEGATLESLNDAVEALRTRLGRLEGAAAAGGRNRRERGNAENDEEAREDDDVMERLEVLAEHMMMSINAIRLNGEHGLGEETRADTPLPPLEALDDEEDDSSGSAPVRERRDSTGYRSDHSMPSLQSVSDTSSEDDDDSDDTEDEEYEAGPELASGGVLSQSQQEEAPEWGREGREAEQVHTNADGGAFLTDGRGRVVWSSEENKSGEEETGSVTESGTGTEFGMGTGTGTESGSGSGSGSGRSFLDWLNTLF